MTPRAKRILWIAAAAILVAVVGTWIFVDVAARRSSFCENCHYMQPFVDQWKASTHKNVACVKCHPTERTAMLAQFVKYVTKTYDPRPRAQVADASCLSSGCHAGMRENKAVTFMGVSFPHQPHLAEDRRGIRLHCASCHGASREAGHTSVDPRVCFLCHFKGQDAAGTIGACGGCHGAPSGETKHGSFTFDMQSYAASGVQCSRCHLKVHEGDGEVPKDRCYSCHVSRVERIGETAMLHQKHVGQKQIRCLDCHEPIRHGNIQVLSVLDVSCESCHQNLHAGPKEMYLGVGAKAAESTPSRMFAAQINCTGCHTQVVVQGGVSFLGQGSKTADPKACAACHDARYIPMVDRWKGEGRELVAEAKRLALEGQRSAARGGQEARSVSAELDFNARFLEQGHPVHNIEYAIKTVQASARLLKELSEKTGGSAAAAQIRPAFARDDFSYCTQACHVFIPRSEPYSFQGVDFPHTYHVKQAGLSCDTCHSAGRHKAMALASPADCAGCHHDSAKADCGRCHPRQKALFLGKLPASLGIAAQPDGMAESVACADCHDPTKADALQEVGKACEGCHEGEGAKTLEEWRSSLAPALKEAGRLIDEAGLALDMMRRRGGDDAPLRRRLQAVSARVDFIRKARGVHNMAASEEALKKAKEELNLILSQTQTPAPGAAKAK